VILSAGQIAVINSPAKTTQDLMAQAIITDKDDDADHFIAQIRGHWRTSRHPIPLQSTYPAQLRPPSLRDRNLIECLFARLKHFRRIADTRDNKLASSLPVLHSSRVCLHLVGLIGSTS